MYARAGNKMRILYCRMFVSPLALALGGPRAAPGNETAAGGALVQEAREERLGFHKGQRLPGAVARACAHAPNTIRSQQQAEQHGRSQRQDSAACARASGCACVVSETQSAFLRGTQQQQMNVTQQQHE